MKNRIIVLLFALCTTQIFAQDIQFEKPITDVQRKMADSLSKNLKPWKVPNKVFKVEDFGAVGDSQTVNTKAIQKAIDICSEKGGGVVLFSKGKYVTGTIDLKSGVMLEVAKNAMVLGSTKIADYPERIEAFKSVMSENHAYRQSLIYAEKCVNVGIRGKGEIYFRGERVNFSSEETVGKIVDRPFGIRMIQCKNVVLQNIFLHNAAAWMQSYIYCQNLIFDGIKVINQANYNNDGLDPDGCTNIIVRNCYINAEDDAMCLKGASGMPSSNFLIENSTFLSSCNALKIGTDTQGDFFNIVARNLQLGGIPKNMYALKRHDASSGITLATVDGGNVHDIHISNVTINETRCPIFIRIGSRLRAVPNTKPKEIGYLKNVVIEEVKGDNNYKDGSLILGIKDHPISNIVIKNYKIKMEGSSDSSLLTKIVPENETGYPDARFFIKQGIPAHGFYIRHANNINITKAEIASSKKEVRPAVVVGNGTSNVLYNSTEIK
jgi:polygalacturonase